MSTYDQSPATPRRQAHSTLLKPQSGLSLVELMISITIGLMLMAGVTALITQQSSASSELNKASRQIENGRYVAQSLREDIELAGFYGEFFDVAAPTAFHDPCAVLPAALDEAATLPLQGYDSPASVPAPLSACLDSANHVPGTDILVIRRTYTDTIAPENAVAGQPYLQAGLNESDLMSKVVGSGSDVSVFTLKKRDGSTAPLRAYAVHIYFVSPCNMPTDGMTCSGSADNGKPIPTLKRLELGVAANAAAFSVVPLAEGIENLQLDYGVDADADGAPDYYTTGTNTDAGVPMTATDWGNVMTVRANILTRNAETTGGHKDTKVYRLGETGEVGPFNDNYKRRVFTEVIRATNPSGRRAR